MLDAKRLLDQFLGGTQPGSGTTTGQGLGGLGGLSGGLDQALGGIGKHLGGFGGGAAMGGLAGLLLGGKGGRNGFEHELRRLGVVQKNSRPHHPTTCGKVCEDLPRCCTGPV